MPHRGNPSAVGMTQILSNMNNNTTINYNNETNIHGQATLFKSNGYDLMPSHSTNDLRNMTRDGDENGHFSNVLEHVTEEDSRLASG